MQNVEDGRGSDGVIGCKMWNVVYEEVGMMVDEGRKRVM